MSFPGFYALGSAWLFLLLIPLIIFYFLKLKRPRLEIPSLALWMQVLDDRRVNSPFQKFKRNLMLLLQLLLLTLLVLACMQPFIQSGSERAEYLPVLVDCSASMAALDEAGGQSRLDLAKEHVNKLIDDLLPDQRLSLIAVHSTARRLTDFTNNKHLLRDALRKITVAEVPSKLEDALRMTQALARSVSIDTVLVYSDGNFPRQVDFALPFELNYQQLPSGGPNIGITEFNARRSKIDTWDVFLRVAASNHSQTAADVELLKDGRSLAEKNVVLGKGESQRLVFSVETTNAASLEIRLKPDGFDSLAADNIAFLDLPESRPLSVYIPPEMGSYRHALRALKKIELYPDDDGNNTLASYDVVMSDRNQDMALEATVRLMVGVIPDDLEKLLNVKTGLASVVDWQRSSPLLQHVQLDGVQIADEPISAEGVKNGDYEELGYEIIAHARAGPLILKKQTGASVSYFLIFHTDQSTLPYRVGFPILVTNVLHVALLQAKLSEVRGRPTMVLPSRKLEPNRNYRITAPDGTRHDVTSDSEGVVSAVPAPLVGRYVVNSGGEESANIGVSLLDENETSLAAVDKIQFRELSVTAAGSELQSDHPLWPMFAFAAFAMLLIEWWFFQRRPGFS